LIGNLANRCIKALFAVLLEPGFHGGDLDFPQTIPGEEVLAFGLLAEVLVLSSCGFSKYRGDDLEAFGAPALAVNEGLKQGAPADL